MNSMVPQRRYSLVLVVFMLVMLVLVAVSAGCASGPQQFDAPEQAADALVSAARTGSTDQIEKILGSDSDELITSGDAVADREALARFVESYDQKHQLVREGDGRVSLVLGNDDWPLPIPIVQTERGDKWYFDTEAGREELINRRIGRNELDAVEVCLAIADAQREYAMRDPQGVRVPVYATKFASSPGKKDGLYWPTAEGEPPSPLGPLVATATEEGYGPRGAGESGPRPYHGYLYRILTAQGPAAKGGKLDYVVNGKLIGGFGVVAFPAEYGNSGVMSFIVNHDGDVYERDLGDDTDAIARRMSEFNPDANWRKVRPPSDGSPGDGREMTGR